MSTEEVIAFGRGATLLIVTVGLLGFAYRLARSAHLGRTMLRNLLIGAGGMLLGTISSIPVPIIWWLHIIGIAGSHYGVLYFYFAIDQLLNGKPQRSTIRSPLFIVTTICTLGTTVLDFLRRDNLTAIIDTLPYKPSWTYFTSEFLHYFVLLYLTFAIFFLYIRDIVYQQPISTIYKVRRGVNVLAFAIAFLTVAAVCVNVVVAAFYGDILRSSINLIYNTNKTIIFTLVLIGFVVPQRVFSQLVYPVLRLVQPVEQWRDKQRPASLTYLHSRMIQIVPHIHLPNNQFRFDRIPIEIDDAREIIWSHYVDTDSPPAPEEEAKLLYRLLTNHERINMIGLTEPPTLQGDVGAYNRAVALHLRQLEHPAARPARGPRTLMDRLLR